MTGIPRPTPMIHTVSVEMDIEVPDGTYNRRPSSYVDEMLTEFCRQRGWAVRGFFAGIVKSVPAHPEEER